MGTITNIKKFTKNENENLGEIIDLILSRKTHNTKIAYRNAYKDFFYYLFNKNYKDCKWEDIEKINYTDIIQYVETKEINLSYNSIKSRLGALQFLAKEISKIKPNYLNPTIFSVDINKQKENNEYGSLSYEEAMDLLDYTKNLQTETSIIQYLFFKTTLATAHRVNSLLKLTWNDINLINENGIEIPIITIYDKTDKFKTPISNELFEELKNNLFKECMEDKIFNISNRTLNRTIISFCKKYNINQKERKIVVHSLKKTSGDIAYMKTGGNIIEVASHLHHKNIQTSYQHYLDKNTKYSEKISREILSNENIDNEINILTENLSKEQLLKIIKNCDILTKNNILKEIKKIDI